MDGTFIVQKRDAGRLHYDFRLGTGGVLIGWAVTKGPSLDPEKRRLAVRTEDHPADYADIEGTIPKAEYGGGPVMLGDRGTFTVEGDPAKGLRSGKLKVTRAGSRLKGGFALVRMDAKAAKEKRGNWLLIKERAAFAEPADRLGSDDDRRAWRAGAPWRRSPPVPPPGAGTGRRDAALAGGRTATGRRRSPPGGPIRGVRR